jgi:hypothetical protein
VTLTRKDFETIARNLRDGQPRSAELQWGYEQAVDAVAQALQEINPRFDRGRFLAACEPTHK